MNTKSFTARPHMCNNDRFLHRTEEVWRTLFEDHQKSKGFFNYSLLSMVYTELILKKKVDWTSFPTIAQFPLRIGEESKAHSRFIQSTVNLDEGFVGGVEE